MKGIAQKWIFHSTTWFFAALAGFSHAAYVINDTGDDFTLTWSHSPATGQMISVIGTFDVTSISTTQLVMNVKFANNSSGFTNAGVTSFGFNATPNATAVSANTTSAYDITSDADRFNDAALSSLPAMSVIDICVYAANNCNGGAQNQLLAMGEVDYFTLTITAPIPLVAGLPTFTLSNITSTNVPGTGIGGLKIQTSNGSFELTANATLPSDPDPALPVPGMLALLGLGAIAMRNAKRM